MRMYIPTDVYSYIYIYTYIYIYIDHTDIKPKVPYFKPPRRNKEARSGSRLKLVLDAGDAHHLKLRLDQFRSRLTHQAVDDDWAAFKLRVAFLGGEGRDDKHIAVIYRILIAVESSCNYVIERLLEAGGAAASAWQSLPVFPCLSFF